MAAKRLLDDKGLSYTEINIEEENMSRHDLAEITGGMTVPQIIINDDSIGGIDKLIMLSQSGELDKLVSP